MKKVLFIIFNKTEYLEDILALLVKHGVKGATILDSQGMGSSIVYNEITNIPLFGSLKTLLTDRHPYNKTIFTVVNSQEKLEKIVAGLKGLLRDDDKAEGTFMFTIPVDEIY